MTDLRQRTAQILDELKGSSEPIAVLQRSETAAYLVDAQEYDLQREELRTARRALFLREVADAEEEYASGHANSYEDMDSLLDDLRS